MKRFPYSSTLLLAALAFPLGLACSSEGDGGDDSTDGSGGTSDGSGGTGTGSGGASTGSGGGNASGGNGNGSGGDTNGSGGTNGGGAAFVCPEGSSSLVLDLNGKTAERLATAPNFNNGNSFLEGPVWIDGALYVSQLRDYGPLNPARILRLDGTSLTEFIADSGTNGLAVRGDGKIVAASQKEQGLVVFDPAAPTTAPSVLVAQYQGAKFNSPNDLVIAENGHIYFTDPDYQCSGGPPPSPCGQGDRRAYHVTPDGTVTAIDTGHNQPNGIALSPDGATLYIAGDQSMEKYTVNNATGAVTSAGQFAETRGVDGLAVDCAGNVYATVHGEGRIEVRSPSGSSLGSIPLGTDRPSVTNAAFGGPDRTTLYITTYAGAQLYSVELNVPGFPY